MFSKLRLNVQVAVSVMGDSDSRSSVGRLDSTVVCVHVRVFVVKELSSHAGGWVDGWMYPGSGAAA